MADRAIRAPFTMHSAATRTGPGPKSTPAFANGRLYSIGMTGIVTAWDAATGKQVWQKPGSTPVPDVHDPRVLAGRRSRTRHLPRRRPRRGALTAFDVNTGAEKWSWKGDGPGYGSPIVADIGGTRQVITITQGKLVGVDAANGTLLWERPVRHHQHHQLDDAGGLRADGHRVGQRRADACAGDRQAGEPVGGRHVWENADIPMRMSNAVIVGDMLFGLSKRNSGQYFAVDAKTGKTLWISEGRQAANAAIARSGDLFFSLEDDGELVVVRNSKTGFEPVQRYKVADAATWAQPAYSGNRILVKDVSTLSLWTLN